MKAPDINKIIITDHRLGIVIHLHCTSSSKLAIQVVVFPIVTITCVANNSYYEKKLASITLLPNIVYIHPDTHIFTHMCQILELMSRFTF